MNGFVPLMWREWRRNRPMLAVAVATIALLILWGHAMETLHPERARSEIDSPGWPLDLVAMAAVLAVIFGSVLLPAVVAHMLAGERADRSAEFVAALPVSRVARLAAKVTFLANVAVATWAPIILFTASRRLVSPNSSSYPSEVLGTLGVLTLLATAIAWLAAVWIDSPVIVTLAAITLPFAVPMAFFSVPAIARLPAFKTWESFFSLWITSGGTPQPLTILIACAMFATGGAFYLRRIA